MTTKHIAVQIDITDQNTDTDATEGLYAGYFRWVSGRPLYDGSTVVPTGDNDGNVWKEGILSQENIVGSPDRLIDLTLGGDYGSLSGFSFTRENTGKFQNYLDTNTYYLINRPIEFHIILGDVFYQCWTGIIADIKYNETTYEIICDDIFESEHKAIPPNTVTFTNSPEALASEFGKPIPVSFGDILRSPIINISGDRNKAQLGFNSGTNKEIYITQPTLAVLDSNDNWALTMKTPNMEFGVDHFIESGDHWLRVIKGDEQSIFIIGNDATTNLGENATTVFSLVKPLDGITDIDELNDNLGFINGYDGVWYYEVLSLKKVNIVSENVISSFPLDTFLNYNLRLFNKNTLNYDPISELISEVDVTAGSSVGRPNISLINNLISISGDFTRLIPVIPKSLQLFNMTVLDRTGAIKPNSELDNEFDTSDFSLLLDKDRSTNLSVSRQAAEELGKVYFFWDVEFPTDVIFDSLDEIYLSVDMQIIMGSNADAGRNDLIFDLSGLDQYGSTTAAETVNISTYPTEIPAGATTNFNLLPNEYYRSNGVDNSEQSVFGSTIGHNVTIDNATAVDKGGGLVGIPITAHPFQQGDTITIDGTTGYDGEEDIVSQTTNEIVITATYTGETFAGTETVSSEVNINTLVKITDQLASDFGKTIAINRFRFIIRVGAEIGLGTADPIHEVKIKQIGFYAKKKINVDKEGTFIKIKGETVSSNETNNVYRTFQHILETYDGFSTVQYNNVSTTRNLWPIGRAVTEKKVSSKYLKELCLSTFVTISPDRYGRRNLSSFREDTTATFTHTDTNGTIINNSITSFQKTPINDVYNEFDLFYDYNPGTKTYNRNIFITGVGEGVTFPAEADGTATDTSRSFTSVTITTNTVNGKSTAVIKFASDPTWANIGDKVSYSTTDTANIYFGTISSKTTTLIVVYYDNTLGAQPVTISTTGTLTGHSEIFSLWKTFVGGINDYVIAKEYWDVCQASYLRTKTVNKYPENLSKLKWFHDPGAFVDSTPSFDSSAHKFLAFLVPWVTRQKEVVSYSIPLTAANLALELVDFGNFTDSIYTNASARTGYIQKIKIDAKNDKIDLEVLLVPSDIEEIPGTDLIIETGDAPDTITESGAQPDTITEQGL